MLLEYYISLLSSCWNSVGSCWNSVGHLLELRWDSVEHLLELCWKLLSICWNSVEHLLEYYSIYMSEAAEDQITKEPEAPIVKQKDPKKVAAGKKLAEYHKNAKKAMSEAPIVETTNNWAPSLTTTLTLVGIGLTALDLYFRWKKEAPIAATTITPTPIPAVAPTAARRGME